jgi:peroxiredoxin
MSTYKDLGAEVLGVSVDGTFVQKGFAEHNNIKYPLASDFNKEVIKKYDVYREDFIHGMKGVSERAVYVIDKDGVIKYAEVTPTPGDMPVFDNIKKAVEGLK